MCTSYGEMLRQTLVPFWAPSTAEAIRQIEIAIFQVWGHESELIKHFAQFIHVPNPKFQDSYNLQNNIFVDVALDQEKGENPFLL